MKRNSIRTKLIVFMLIATIIPIMTTMFVSYSYTTQSIKKRTLEVTQNLLFQGQRNVTAVLDDLNRSSLNVYSDAELYRELQTSQSDLQSDSRVYASLAYIKSSVPEVHQVYLYASLGERATIVTNISSAKRMTDVAVFPELERYVASGEATALQPTHMSHTYGFASLQPLAISERVITLHRRIERIPSSDTLGYLSMDVKLSFITDIISQLYDPNEERLYVIDDQGYVVIADDEQLLGKRLAASWYGELKEDSGTRGHLERDGALFVYEKVQTPIANWTLVKRIPTAYLMKDANQAAVINLLLLALSLIVIVIATVIISLRITAPIKQLVHYMNQVQAGRLDIPIHSTSKDEIGLVLIRFRSMMSTINDLIVREYKLELANKTNQLRALQAQINPHFLNNTIQIIGTLALELGVPRIYALLSALARMMRYSMDNETGTITLSDELAHLQAYIELQKERYENSFEYRTEVDDSLLKAVMPKMILQPVIENYFKHGMDKAADDGLLVLRAKSLDDSWMEITVENNGASIPADKLAALQIELAGINGGAGMRTDETEELDSSQARADTEASDVMDSMRKAQAGTESRIGLYNVLARMRMVYGEGAKLYVENRQPGGVKITLIMRNASGGRGFER